MKPEVKKFTKKNPCTKVEIWNCFRGRRGYRSVPIPEAQSYIGVNVPRVLLRNGYAEIQSKGEIESYFLTESGKLWLREGVIAHLKRHPERKKDVNYLPKSW